MVKAKSNKAPDRTVFDDYITAYNFDELKARFKLRLSRQRSDYLRQQLFALSIIMYKISNIYMTLYLP